VFDHDTIILGNDVLDEQTINKFPNLKMVMRFGVGLDNVDTQYLTRKNIQLEICENCAGIPIAYYVLSFTMYYGRGLDLVDEHTIPKEPCEMTVGVIGMGSTGTETASLMRGMGFNVLVSTRRDMEKVSLNELLERCDVVSIHLSLNDETRNFLDKKQFEQMKKGSVLINVARKEVVSDNIVPFLGHIRKYVCDFENDLQHKDVVTTPHIAGRSTISSQRRAAIAMKKIGAFYEAIRN
jgi:glycerate dehydrogenase/D-3-phosphoglycerate dehydrogenase